MSPQLERPSGKLFETPEAFRAEAERRFGTSALAWRFRCPSCGRVSEGREFREAGAAPDAMARECIGRYRGVRGNPKDGNGCDWAAFGLMDICTVHVLMVNGADELAWVPVFEFGPEAVSHG